jgi:hypothetical protein
MNPANAQLVKDVREPIFDTLTLAAGAMAKSIPMFVQAQNGTTIGPEITNMTMPNGQLPNPQRHQIYSVRIELIGFSKADAIGLIQNYAVKVALNGSPYLHAPITFCPQGGGIVGDEFNGIADPRATLQLPEDFKIDWTQGTQLTFQLVSGAGYMQVAGGVVRVWLDGIHTISAVA